MNKTKKSKSKSKSKRTQRHYRKKTFRGGLSSQPLVLQAQANQVYGFLPGASSASESARMHLHNQTKAQTEINSRLSGGGRKNKKQRGGQTDAAAPTTSTVTQFNLIGPSVSPLNANTNSATVNQHLINGQNNAMNDGYATADAPAPTPAQDGGKRKRKQSKKSKTRTKRKSRKILKIKSRK
jgi:hypothetical protein